jgi:hypothetical protein
MGAQKLLIRGLMDEVLIVRREDMSGERKRSFRISFC